MSEYDFGEEHLKFMFERWRIKAKLAETEKQGEKNITSAEELIQQADWLESRLNRYMGNLENWMEGSKEKLKE
ncbi:hypothetical protein [Sutcliffiella deserti]|uniref:hypothetical protein n=1 Tax=Sutcliffiella deserti TaxID=2875501 RepID=UPI001CBF44F3|nr:hypothetical protein [Sutcliffiella deserti]